MATKIAETSMVRLINNLKALAENSEAQLFIEEWDDGRRAINETTDHFQEAASEELKELMSEVIGDLNEWLIADTGHHHVPNRETLRRLGYRFEKGEEDAFGPLTSIIVLKDMEGKDFRIVYG